MSQRLRAELYALTHRGKPGDVGFYTRVCKGAARVLELGTGYGRLLTALAQPSRRVVGLEIDDGLLALARKRVKDLPKARRSGVTLLRADMRHFEVEAAFDRVLVPYNAFYCLLRKSEVRSCLRSVRGALKHGGVLVFDVWNADGWNDSPSPRSLAHEAEPLVAVEHAGRAFTVYEQTRSRGRERLDVTYEYVPRSSGRATSIRIPQRYFRSGELFELLEREGFVVRSLAGNFHGGRFSASSPELIVTASLAD